jgi:ABC-type Fe3+-hydroxamate transport system substrate-binding protein
LVLLVFGTACSPEPQTAHPDELRIVSFMPSATRIVVDLGLGDRIVGVAEHDAAAPEINADGNPMPIVGHYLDVDREMVLSLRPTHVIFPQTKAPVAYQLDQWQTVKMSRLLLEPYPESVAAVAASTLRLGTALGRPDKAAELAASLNLPYPGKAVGSRSDQPWPRTLMVFSVGPVMASGPGTINHDLLLHAGLSNAVGDAAVSAVSLDLEAVLELDPEVIVLLLPGATKAEAAAKRAWFDDLPIAAVRDGRVHLMTDPQVLLPATNLPEVLTELSEVVWSTERTDPTAAAVPTPTLTSTPGAGAGVGAGGG